MWASTTKKYIHANKELCYCLTDIVASWIRLGAKNRFKKKKLKITHIHKLYMYKAFVLTWAVTIFHYHLPASSRTRSPIFWLWSRVSANYCSCWDIRSIFITTTTRSKLWILLNYLVYQFLSIMQITILYISIMRR